VDSLSFATGPERFICDGSNVVREIRWINGDHAADKPDNLLLAYQSVKSEKNGALL
jgi:hypothetical protein